MSEPLPTVEIDAPVWCLVCNVSSEGGTYLAFITEHADHAAPECIDPRCVPKWMSDQQRAQIRRLQDTIEKYQQKENDHAHGDAELGRIVESSSADPVAGMESEDGELAATEGLPSPAELPGVVGRTRSGEVVPDLAEPTRVTSPAWPVTEVGAGHNWPTRVNPPGLGDDQ